MITDLTDKYTKPDQRIAWARSYNDKLMLHVHGVGLDKALEQINNYENDAQKAARDKFAISNKFITDRLLRPTDNVFSAKGGHRKYYFNTEQESQEQAFVGKLIDVYSGYNLSQYIHRVWFDKYIVDPNGLLFMEVSEDGKEIYPTYKSIYSIRNYKQDGIKVEWVLFEPDVTVYDDETQSKVDEEHFWAVDEDAYYRCVSKDGEVTVIEERPHSFGEVPARLCSDFEDHVTGWKKSPIDSQIELLHKFMIDNSVLNIVEFFHCYPQQWTYVDECARCNGTGEVHDAGTQRDGTIDNTCPVCSGTGKAARKDVTDIIALKVPGADEQKIDPPSGYIEAPTESWDKMEKSQDRTWNIIMFSHWGTSLEYGSTEGTQYATATGRFIDTQPVNNKLNRYTESVQLIHNAISDIYGRFYYPKTFTRSDVVYGRRYLIETPDQLLRRYSELSNLTDDTIIKEITYDQYLESEFRDNEQLYTYYKKLNALDPLPHVKIETVKELGQPEQLNRKLYINAYKNSREMSFIIQTPLEQLKQDYDKFLKTIV